MTSPLGIPHDHSSSQDTRFADEGFDRLESTSFGSNCTDLSITSRDVIVADQWTVSEKIGEGSFGEVFKVRDIKTSQCYAIKRENLRTKHSQLKYESTMYEILSGGVGIPRCYWHGHFDGFECIVMDLLGPNLGQVRQNVSLMELDIAIDLACQLVSIVEDIHNRGVIVRDIKPDNFLFSSKHNLPETETIETMDKFGMPLTSYKKRSCKQIFDEQWGDSYPQLYAVDFGLACYWRDPETGKTYPDTKKHVRSKTGTARYASINVHRGRSHSRRDDMESIGYIILDLLMGTLPWTGIHAKNSKAGWDRMRQLKTDTFMSDLCAGLPDGILKFVEYPRKLQFGDQPDYEKLRQYLRGSLPGGAYADLVKSPFGGGIKSTDNYDIIQQELEQLEQKQLLQQQQILDQYNRNMQYMDNNNNEDRDGAFTMNDATQQLAKTTVSESEGGKSQQSQQRKVVSSSQSSIQKLLKENLTKTVGWNTYKHDQAPWNPKTDWTNDNDEAGGNLAGSWGDNKQEMNTWGIPPTSPLDQTESWGNDSDVKEVKWNEQTSWGTAPTIQHDKKVSNNGNPVATKWGEQPTWDTAPATTQHDKEDSMNCSVKPKWGDQPLWRSTNTTQHDSRNPPVQAKWQKRDEQPAWEAKQNHKDSWNANKNDDLELQWKEASSWANSTKEGNGRQQSTHTVSSNDDDAMKSTWQTIQQPGVLDRGKQAGAAVAATHLNNDDQQQQQLDKPMRERYHSQSQRRSHPFHRYGVNDNLSGESYQQQQHQQQRFSHHFNNGTTTNTKVEDIQVDGWQRKPGSNSWQQKRRPHAK